MSDSDDSKTSDGAPQDSHNTPSTSRQLDDGPLQRLSTSRLLLDERPLKRQKLEPTAPTILTIWNHEMHKEVERGPPTYWNILPLPYELTLYILNTAAMAVAREKGKKWADIHHAFQPCSVCGKLLAIEMTETGEIKSSG